MLFSATRPDRDESWSTATTAVTVIRGHDQPAHIGTYGRRYRPPSVASVSLEAITLPRRSDVDRSLYSRWPGSQRRPCLRERLA
jgi:hypothetical protein